jgi:hypothetical protein
MKLLNIVKNSMSDFLSQHLYHNSYYPTLSITLSKFLVVTSRLNISCVSFNPLPAILVIVSNTNLAQKCYTATTDYI